MYAGLVLTYSTCTDLCYFEVDVLFAFDITSFSSLQSRE